MLGHGSSFKKGKLYFVDKCHFNDHTIEMNETKPTKSQSQSI